MSFFWYQSINKFISPSFILGTIVFFLSLLPSPAFGQENFKGELVVSPAKIEIVANPGEEKEFQIRVANGFDKPVTLRVNLENLGGSKDAFIGAELIGDSISKNSLSGYLHPIISSFTVNPGEVVSLPVVIRLPEDVEPVGRYGAVIFSISGGGDGSGNAQTLVDTRVGTTIFVRPTVNIEESGEIVDYSSRNHTYIYVWDKPAFVVSLKNVGNVHLNPYGGIIIRNIFGLEKYRSEIAPWFVLPGSVRSSMIETSPKWLLGYYKADLSLSLGYGNVEPRGSISFWAISKEWIVTIIVLVALGFILLVIRKIKKTNE